MFDEMIDAVREDTARLILTAELVIAQKSADENSKKVQNLATGESKHPTERKKTKIGRNEPCPCGSGKKYKNCCGRNN